MPKQPLDDLAVACGASAMVSCFTAPKGPRTSVQFKINDGSLERFAAAILAETLPGAAISVDVSVGEVDAGDRIFACVDEIMGQGADAVIIATETSRNFCTPDKALKRGAERYHAVRDNPSLTMEEHEAIFLSPEEIDQRADKAIKEKV